MEGGGEEEGEGAGSEKPPASGKEDKRSTGTSNFSRSRIEKEGGEGGGRSVREDRRAVSAGDIISAGGGRVRSIDH